MFRLLKSFGFTQITALNGKTIIGTVSANGDVGTTGGETIQ